MSISFDDALATALRATGAEAELRRHPRQTLEHFLYVVVRDGWAEKMLTQCGCDLHHLRTELAEYLELQPERPARASAAIKLDPPFERALTRAGLHALSTGKVQLAVPQVLVGLVHETESYAAILLRAEGVNRLELVQYLTYGHPGPLPSAQVPLDRHQLAVVIVHNDDYTAMDFVIQVLCKIFDLSLKEATALMLRIHQQGQAVVGVYPAAIAEDKVALVHAQAAAAEFPLRCTCQPK